MKRFIPLCIFFLFLTVLGAAEKKADETVPPLLRGFQAVSDQELSDGWVLLFDGKTFFGWDAQPLVDRRPLGVPDPKIQISGGAMKIETQIPIRIATPLFPVQPWGLELRYKTDPDFEGALLLCVPEKNGMQKPQVAEIRLEPASETKTVTVGAADGTFALNGQFMQLGAQVVEKGVMIVINRGTLQIDSFRYQQKKTPLFSGSDLTGWKVSGDAKAEAADGAVHLTGGSGDLESEILFSDGVVSFEFKENATPCNSGFFFRSIPESAMDGYECQMNNAPPEEDRAKFLGNDTGSIFRRCAARRVVPDSSDWTGVTLMADGSSFRTWVNGIPALLWTDDRKADPNPRKGLRREAGTFQFQGHDPSTDVLIRRVGAAAFKPEEAEAVSRLAETFAAPPQTEAESDDAPNAGLKTSPENAAFEAFRPRMEQLERDGIQLTDFHIHLRGSMNAEKALQRQKETGIVSGVLENAGREWPLSDNEKIAAFIDEVRKVSPDDAEIRLPIGLQVNDRDWYKEIDPEILKRLDFILADSMIMGTTAEGKQQRLWLLPADYEVNLDEWMEEYMNHYRQILDEPITILANPTYLPLFAADRYDELWTDERMDEIIDKAAEKGIALEIQAESPFPSDRFIQKALDKGVKISFGTNNFDDVLKKLDRWDEAFEKFNLKNENILKKEDIAK